MGSKTIGRAALFSAVSFIFPFPVHAQIEALDITETVERQLSSLPYDSLSPLALGDGVEITRLDRAYGNCIDLENSPIETDIPNGAIEVSADINVISTVKEIERKLNRSLGAEASVSGNYLRAVRGSLRTRFTDEFESFIRESSSSLMISVKISADHGRDWLDYRLKPEFQNLIDNREFDEFRQVCGTHFVRAIKKEAYLEYNITVSGLSSLAKQTLAKSAKENLQGQGGIGEVFSIGGGVSKEEKFTRFLKTASQFGTIDIQAKLVGASGIDALAPVRESNGGPGTEIIRPLFANLGTIASSFRDTNGAPSQMILARYAALPEFDASYTRFYVLGEIARKLLLARTGLSQSESIEEELPQMWSDYFESDYNELQRVEAALLSEHTRCYESYECSLTRLPDDPNPLTINDILFDGDLRANCGMDAKVNISGTPYKVMSDIAVYWRGWMRFPNYVSLASVEAFYIDESLERKNTIPFEYEYEFSIHPNYLRKNDPDDRLKKENPGEYGNRIKGPAHATFQIVNYSFPLDEIIINGKHNEQFLKDTLRHFEDGTYGLSFRFSNGWVVTQLIGKPDSRQCRTSEELQKPRDVVREVLEMEEK